MMPCSGITFYKLSDKNGQFCAFDYIGLNNLTRSKYSFDETFNPSVGAYDCLYLHLGADEAIQTPGKYA